MLLFQYNCEISNCEKEDPKLFTENDDQSLVYFNTLPKKQYAKGSKTSMRRHLLKQINSLAFLVIEK